MTDFSHLKNLEVKDNTEEYPLSFIAGEPVLIVKPATESNKGYFNAVLRKSRQTLKAAKNGVNAKMVKQNREEDRELYSEHVIVGWNGIKDKNGDPVEHSVKNVLAFLEQLPDWIFDEIRTFCGQSANFVKETINVEEKLGN